MNLSVAAHISDRVTDQVIESLSGSYKSLIGECGANVRTRSSTPDVLRSSAGSTSNPAGGGSVLGVGMSVSISAGTPLHDRGSIVLDDEEDEDDDDEDYNSQTNDTSTRDNSDRVVIGKAMGRLSNDDDSPMVSYFVINVFA